MHATEQKLNYSQAGVDYAKIDPLKIMAQQAARATAPHLRAAGFEEVAASRGESAYVIDMGEFYLASITECLGTKSLVADQMYPLTGKTYYDQIAQDTIAMAVNDLLTVGARPLTLHAYWAAGGKTWFENEQRMRDLVDGWRAVCDRYGIVWGGGETPSLSGIVEAGAIDLAASCVGIIRPKERLTLGQRLQAGDAVILLESSGIHANGITLARKLAERLPDGYATRIADGRMFGEALLDPTIIYASTMEALFAANVEIHYIANITGHGWRKLLRHPSDFTYRMTTLPPIPPVLSFMMEQAGLDAAEAYGSLNMGAGFALFVAAQDAEKTVAISEQMGSKTYLSGMVETGPKRVCIEPLDVVFEGDSLALRA